MDFLPYYTPNLTGAAAPSQFVPEPDVHFVLFYSILNYLLREE